jgi:hypothetical protein
MAPVAARATAGGDFDRTQYRNRLSIARAAYFKVIASNDRATNAAAHLALDTLEREYPGDAVARAYQGSLELLDAAHSWDIWNLRRQTNEGLGLLDAAVAEAAATDASGEPEARFIRAATSWHLPAFLHRREQSEADFALLAQRAEIDAREGRLPPELAAAVYDYWGQILVGRKDLDGARASFQRSLRVAAQSPGAADAARRLADLR